LVPKSKGKVGKSTRILLLCAVAIIGALLLSIYYASPAIRSWTAFSALLIAQPFAFLTIWLPAIRLARLAGAPVTIMDAFLANALSIAGFMIIPGRISEALKPVVMRFRCGLPLARGLTAVALERLLDLACLAGLATIAAAGTAGQYTGALREASIILALVSLVAVAILGFALVAPELSLKLVEALPLGWIRSTGAEIFDAVLRVRGIKTLAVASTLSLLTWAASYLIFFIIIRRLGVIDLTSEQILLVFVAGTLGFVITIMPGGIGTYEGAIMLALGSFGYRAADALAIALLLRIANLMPAIPAASWLLVRSGVALSNFVARARAEPPTL
jgi:uncharacterized membrane protein YbhN (UPF0104 family)